MTIEWLFNWWNAVYTVPLALVLVFLAVTSLAGLAGGAFDALSHGHAHVGVGHDLEAHGHGHAELHAGGEHAGADHAHDCASHPAGDGLFTSVLLALGGGRAPLLFLLQVFFLLWGVIGLGMHQALQAAGPLALLWSVPAALVVSAAGTRTAAVVFGRYLAEDETSALKRDQIVGRTGKVVLPVTPEEGTVHVRDLHGTLHRLRARSHHGELDTGREIIVLGYDPEAKVYHVDDASAFIDRP